jgi:signal transduction histidine kinase
MMQESVERRSEFRFPIVLPAEYFKPGDSGILSYSLDLNKMGTFISSDDPLVLGSRFGMHLTIPVDYESSKIFRTQGTVTWNKIQPFKSKTNGMGVKFIDPLPEDLLLYALAHNFRKLVKETEAKGLLEERVEKLESELEEAKRLAALGRCVEKILFDISNPILTLSGNLEIIKTRMYEHKRMLEEHEETNKEEFKEIVTEFDKSCDKIDQILKDYKIISELAKIAGHDRETLERELKRYNC